jgi:kynureninase
VHYKSGRMHDMKQITKLAHDAGALVLWDLSHSAGALELDLNGVQVDFAVGCGYKYLNGGPGAPAFLFVAKRHHQEARSPLCGWMGHAAPFAFDDSYQPAQGIRRFLCGTPDVLGLSALDASLDVILQAEIRQIARKSRDLSERFIQLVEQRCAGYGLELASPRDPSMRGSHVAFRHIHGYPIMQALIHAGVIGDFRAPDILRFGFAPLYLRYSDIWRAVSILSDILQSGSWKDAQFHKRLPVT